MSDKRRYSREELNDLGIDPVDIEQYLAGEIDIAFEPPRSKERTPFGDSIYGYGFGILFNAWDALSFPEHLKESRVQIPLKGVPVLQLQQRLLKSALAERIRSDKLQVILWDDAFDVHIEGSREHVAIIEKIVRDAIRDVPASGCDKT